MPLPPTDTLVSYPAGSVRDRAIVLAVVVRDTEVVVLTDVTPFHPVDPRWPDQGTDLGTLACAAGVARIPEATIGATDGTELFVGTEVTVRRGTPGWAFVVAHLLPVGGPLPVEGETVTLAADGGHRAPLSAGHSACHVAALALNAALADRWRQPLGSGGRTDGLGNPDFDQLAITSSVIHPYGATDTYGWENPCARRVSIRQTCTASCPGWPTGPMTYWPAGSRRARRSSWNYQGQG